MKILDRYVFVEWLKAFLATVCVMQGILILHDMYNNLGDLIEFGAGAKNILLYYRLVTPSFVPVILPISLLISVIFVLGNFHKNNEITAMRAAGMNVFRITRVLWLSGIALAGLLFWLNAQVVPASVEGSRALFERLEYAGKSRGAAADAVGRISNLCFLNRPDNRLWFISKYSRPSKRANGIEVHVFDNGGVEREKILAKEGVFDDVKMSWFFTDGQVINFDENGAALKSEYFKRRDFDNFRDDPEVMRLAMSRAKDLSLYELRRLISASGGGDSEIMRPYAVKLAGVWASPFACVIVVAIAIPFSIAGVRTNPMVGVSKTAGLFFGYYILDSVFSSMGTTGVLPITLAAWIPNIFMLAFALSLYRKHV